MMNAASIILCGVAIVCCQRPTRSPLTHSSFWRLPPFTLGGGAGVARGTVHELCLSAVAGTEITFPDLAPAGELICGGDLNHGIPVLLSVRLCCWKPARCSPCHATFSHMASLGLPALHRT